MATGERSTLSIGECAREWATKALAGPPHTDLHWLIATAFVSGGAEQTKRDGTYPCDDERPSDVAQLAAEVARELRKTHGIRAMRHHKNGVFVGEYYYDMACKERWMRLGPIAIAAEIKKLECARTMQDAGETNAT